jgi:molybdopterin/thiamine biosynthesis adenylyltransferase
MTARPDSGVGIADGRWQRVAQIPWYRRDLLAQSRAIVVGLGALGQPVATHLVMNGVGSIVLLDRDTVTARNLPVSPLFVESDVGRPKAVAAAERLRSLNAACHIAAVHADLRDVGQGLWRSLRSSPRRIVFGATDNRAARLLISERCWRWGPTPYVDGGIDGRMLAGVVKVFLHDAGDSACYECAMSPDAYAEAQAALPCDAGAEDTTAPTVSTIAAITGAAMAGEGLKLLLGLDEFAAVGRELYFDCMRNALITSRLTRNPRCMSDHVAVPEDWVIELGGPDAVTVGEAFDAAAEALGGDVRLDLGREAALESVASALSHAALVPGAPHTTHVLDRTQAGLYGHVSLAQFGVPGADIIAAYNGSGDERYLQMGSAQAVWSQGRTDKHEEDVTC